MDELIRALPIFAAMTLTPIVMRIWGRFSPPRHVNESTRKRLIRRYLWLDISAFALGLAASLWVVFYLFEKVPSHDPIGLWVIGLLFGLMVILPIMLICVLTLPFGLSRFNEFWQYYEVQWGVSRTGIWSIYIPLGVLGSISAVRLWIALG